MKKTLKTLAIATAGMITTGAIAGTTNMENPLFIPKSGEFFSKTGAGLMYKRSDHTLALQAKNHAGVDEFPVWRATEDFGYGITDRLTTYLSLGYTYNGDIDRKGMHRGRLGLNYRIFEDASEFVWDVYGELYMSGVSPMKGSYGMDGFTYKNFSNGRWGGIAGTRFGKTWDKFTASMFAEYLQTIGNHNNEIEVDPNMQFDPVGHPGVTMSMVGFPHLISVDLKSTNETTIGLSGFYEANDTWSFGGTFKFVEHSDNGVKSIHTPITSAGAQQVADKLLAATADMDDGWQEYVLTAVVSNQISESVQLSLVGEYTFDKSHPNSQNGTDAKLEMGVRANVRF